MLHTILLHYIFMGDCMSKSVYKEAKISVYVIAGIMIISLLFFFVASMFTSMGYSHSNIPEEEKVATASKEGTTIIIDPGHGGEDPGATVDEILEKTLNLEVALYLKEIFSSFGYEAVLTRTDDRLLYHSGEEHRKKFFDLQNRVKFAEQYEDAIFISIHMNKFPSSYCKGLQTFYSENNTLSKTLAEAVQHNITSLQAENTRTIKSGNDTIYLMNKLQMPAILVECGFISNYEEAKLLSDKEYQRALAFSIYCGVSEVLQEKIV